MSLPYYETWKLWIVPSIADLNDVEGPSICAAPETLAVKIYRLVRTSKSRPLDVLRTCLTDYQNPVPPETLEFQIRLAVSEADDLEFLPSALRGVRPERTQSLS